MSDPDFISRAVDDRNRFNSVKPDVNSYKYQTRLLEKKKAFLSEHISLRLTHSEDHVSKWSIPRFRLSKEMLEDACNRARASFSNENEVTPVMLSHIYGIVDNTVILPDQMQSQCKTAPASYDVIVRSAGGITSGGLLSCNTGTRRMHLEQQLGNDSETQIRFTGDLCFLIKNVPTKSQNGLYLVTPEDIRTWIVDGATRDDDSMKIPRDKLLTAQQTLQKLEREYRGLLAMESPLDSIKRDIERTKREIEEAQMAVNAAREKHRADCSLSITLILSERKSESEANVSWRVVVKGRKREYYQRLIENNTRWCLVPMHAFGDPEKSKRKSKPKDPVMTAPQSDLADHFVDVGGIVIEKLPDGFGVYECYDDKKHSLYYGNFCRGAMHGEGTLCTDEGVYSGHFAHDERVGYGKFDFSDNITITGEFALYGTSQGGTEEVNGLPGRPNPYSKGLPHGNVHVQFANGDEYEGEMCNGNITGRGVYRYAVQK